MMSPCCAWDGIHESMSWAPFDHVHTLTSPNGGTCNSLLPGSLIQVLNGPFPHFNTQTQFRGFLSISCSCCILHAEGFSLGCSCHHYYAATDCAWFMYLTFLHSPVHTSWNSINVVNNSRLEYLRLAIIVVFLLRAICSSSYGPYLCQQIKSRLDWCRFADPRTNVYF